MTYLDHQGLCLKQPTGPPKASPEYTCSHWCTICSASRALPAPRRLGLQQPQCSGHWVLKSS